MYDTSTWVAVFQSTVAWDAIKLFSTEEFFDMLVSLALIPNHSAFLHLLLHRGPELKLSFWAQEQRIIYNCTSRFWWRGFEMSHETSGHFL